MTVQVRAEDLTRSWGHFLINSAYKEHLPCIFPSEGGGECEQCHTHTDTHRHTHTARGGDV